MAVKGRGVAEDGVDAGGWGHAGAFVGEGGEFGAGASAFLLAFSLHGTGRKNHRSLYEKEEVHLGGRVYIGCGSEGRFSCDKKREE